MSIPENILNQMKCCLYNDGHIVHEPILLKCGANACKKCVSDSTNQILKCNFCNCLHELNDLLNSPKNELMEYVVTLFLDDLFQDLNKKLECAAASLKGFRTHFLKHF
jgi:hypothetical protein